MKTTTFTLTAMGLGLLAGVTLMHHQQVNEMVARGSIDQRSAHAEMNLQAVVQNPKPVSHATELVVSDVAARVPSEAFYPPRTDREDALLELLAEMRKEQKKMHKQMAEQNRELAELTFRVDTHSDSFKPLRTDSSRPKSLGNPAVGPQIPIGDDDSLLPPRPTNSVSP